MTFLVSSVNDRIIDAASRPVDSVADVIAAFEAIDQALPDSDGLKWFNWLYLTVTRAVDLSIGTQPWNCPDWLTRLDVEFARLYLAAMIQCLTAQVNPPKCWRILMTSRNDARLARIQFALAGMNAHINHDLPVAVCAACDTFGIEPLHGSPQYRDYCGVNDLLDGIVEQAKRELLVGLLGNPLPCLDLVENLVAMWGLRAAREGAWTNSEFLRCANTVPGLTDRFLTGLDDATELAGRGLLAPVGI
jgi:hypothetical protein